MRITEEQRAEGFQPTLGQGVRGRSQNQSSPLCPADHPCPARRDGRQGPGLGAHSGALCQRQRARSRDGQERVFAQADSNRGAMPSTAPQNFGAGDTQSRTDQPHRAHLGDHSASGSSQLLKSSVKSKASSWSLRSFENHSD